MVHHSAALVEESGDAALPEAVATGRSEDLSPRLRALVAYAVALTVDPGAVGREDVAALQRAGLSPRECIDANQVVAYFNYVNRIAEGLGVELEDTWPAAVREERSYSLRRPRQEHDGTGGPHRRTDPEDEGGH